MKKDEILKYLREYYNKQRLYIDIESTDFNIYKITILINYIIPEIEIEYKYDNHLTIIGNIYKIIEEIDKSILNYFKGGN